MGPPKKPPHDCLLCLAGNLFIGGGSLRHNRAPPDPRIGIEDDRCCGVAKPTYLCARLMSGTRLNSAVGALRPTPLPPLLFREAAERSEEHTSELQSRPHLVCRLLLEKKKNNFI